MRALRLLVAASIVLAAAAPAWAIPAFARKYGTSCITCHTIYPKLTPFGEAFRRNGYQFPGKDADYIKQETVSLGNEAYKKVFPNAVWPAAIPDSVPLALGFNGQVTFHPDTGSGAAQQDNGTVVSLHDLIAEAHLWAGGSFTPHIAYFAELTFSTDGVEIEHAELHFNDLFGPKHLFNVYVGRGFPTLTSFAPHSSYVADTVLPGLAVTALYGGKSDAFNVLGEYNLIEVNGMFRGRFIYSVGVNSGANFDVRNAENVYAHLGFKLGGMRLDGEGGAPANPSKPWAERAITIDVFGTRSGSHFQTSAVNLAMNPIFGQDTTWVAGVHGRAQLDSLELNAGFYQEWHDHALADGTSVTAYTQYDELSYMIFPWLVAAARVELTSLHPAGQVRVNDVRFVPGVAALVLPNLKLTLTGQMEWANGVPDGGWGAVNGFAAPTPAMGSVTELESIQLGLAYAF